MEETAIDSCSWTKIRLSLLNRHVIMTAAAIYYDLLQRQRTLEQSNFECEICTAVTGKREV